MTRDLVISASAEAELDDHAAFIAWDSSAAATRFLGAAKQTFQTLLRMPRAGRRITPICATFEFGRSVDFAII